jgi:RimJ/RimL family protein N-acetyltransferase
MNVAVPDMHFESVNYFVRPLEDDDAGLDWGDWTNDPFNAALLNAKPFAMSVEERRQYIGDFAGRNDRFIIGVFEKASGTMIGFGTLFLDREHKEFLGNILLGHPDHRNLGVGRELRDLFYGQMFEVLDFEAARANVVATNSFMIDLLLRRAWTLEHTSFIPDSAGQGVTEMRHLRLSRNDWRSYINRQKEKAA